MNIDYNMAFSISALLSSLDPYQPKAIADGWYGSRPRADMDRGMVPWSIWKMPCYNMFIERLLHEILYINPGISPMLPYQARQRSWGTDMGRGVIARTIWKISCYNLFITYFTLTFSSIDFYIAEKISELTNCEYKSLRKLHLFNFQIFWFQKDITQCRSVQWR